VGVTEVLNAAQLHQLARDCGYDLCGFARADPIPAEVLTTWLEAGYDADMDWMGRRAAERLDPSKLLPGAATVVSFACSYLRPESEETGPIARYARGRDYHATMKDRLRAFRRGLAAIAPAVQTYGSVDHGPMMEKVWAARAGVGYVGRNGCLITESHGSYVVLAALILDAPVDRYADGPSLDRCGSCNLCVSACPTDAIDAHGYVDARRCLAYQTIENETEIPTPLRPGLVDLVFGCDVCQEVCPLNREVAYGGERFAPRAVASLSVRELAALSREQYQQLIAGTPLGRATYDGLRRNAAYALGAAADSTARELLQRLAEDPSERVALAAKWALGQLPQSI
jgi:epoxyqueuosine reductase